MKSIFSKKLLFLSVSTITLVSSVLISCQENSQTTTKNQQTTSSQKPSQNSSKSSQANIIKELTTLNKNVVDNELKPWYHHAISYSFFILYTKRFSATKR